MQALSPQYKAVLKVPGVEAKLPHIGQNSVTARVPNRLDSCVQVVFQETLIHFHQQEKNIRVQEVGHGNFPENYLKAHPDSAQIHYSPLLVPLHSSLCHSLVAVDFVLFANCCGIAVWRVRPYEADMHVYAHMHHQETERSPKPQF